MLTRICCGLFAACLLPIGWAEAGDRENEIELERAQDRVRTMLREAEKLKERGSHEDARHLVAKAEELQAKINEIRARNKGKARHKKEDTRAVLDGLERGIKALKAIGRNKEAEHLMEIAVGFRRELEQRSKHREHGEKERKAARKHLTVMGYALDGLVKAKKGDSAEMLERAMHARELRLEGRRDKEALHIYERSPSRGQVIELLMYGRKMLLEFGNKEKAHAVGNLVERMTKEKKRDSRKEYRVEVRREKRFGPKPDAPMGRMKHLEDRLARLEKGMEEIQAMLREMAADRRR